MAAAAFDWLPWYSGARGMSALGVGELPSASIAVMSTAIIASYVAGLGWLYLVEVLDPVDLKHAHPHILIGLGRLSALATCLVSIASC